MQAAAPRPPPASTSTPAPSVGTGLRTGPDCCPGCDPTRVKILWALLQGESSVACLAELVGAAPTAVSQHLAKLRLSGLVTGRRQGAFVYYSAAADVHVRNLLDEALFHAEHTDRDLGEPQPHLTGSFAGRCPQTG